MLGGSGKFLLLPSCFEIPVLNANSVDPDRTPRSAASGQVYTFCQCRFYGTLGINGLSLFMWDNIIRRH